MMNIKTSRQIYPVEQVLQVRFGITTGFQTGQREIIETLLDGQRVLAIQRTGWGKSLCYQLPSVYFPHLTLVFSPLKALMRDQCQRCNTLYDLPAAIISSDFTKAENKATITKAVAGRLKILFIAPERLQNVNWQDAIQHMRISLVVIDEAHCISVWGEDFRPAYRHIVYFLTQQLPHAPVLALTATASPRVETDILQQIGSSAKVIRGNLKRPNLCLDVVHTRGEWQKRAYLFPLLSQLQGTGILYTATRESAQKIAAQLQQRQISAACYHGGLSNQSRQEIEQDLLENRYKVICSTNALGMGINKPDLRFVIHYHMPSSPIHYYQEVGRAGRDGQSAHCILLYARSDAGIQRQLLQRNAPQLKHYQAVVTALEQFTGGLKAKELGMQIHNPSPSLIKTVLTDLQEHGFVQQDSAQRYTIQRALLPLDFSLYMQKQARKSVELQAMIDYALSKNCYMQYLTSYLGDSSAELCGICGTCSAKPVPVQLQIERWLQNLEHFLARHCSW